jgi:hypothetical protein
MTDLTVQWNKAAAPYYSKLEYSQGKWIELARDATGRLKREDRGAGRGALLAIIDRWTKEAPRGSFQLGEAGYSGDWSGTKEVVDVVNWTHEGKGFYCHEISGANYLARQPREFWLRTPDEVANFLENKFPGLKPQTGPAP